jgi:hypothetical protein
LSISLFDGKDDIIQPNQKQLLYEVLMYEWRTGRSCVYKNHVHLVFVTKYRRDVFTQIMLDKLNEILMNPVKQSKAIAGKT